MKIHRMKISTLLLCATFSLATVAQPQAATEPITPPYAESFANDAFVNDYTIVDVNNDGVTWGPYLGSVQISYNSNEAMNDWLITPALALEGGKIYNFSIEVMTGSGSYNESFEVMYGKENTPESMTETIIEKMQVAHTVYKSYSGTLSPSESGTYYIGIHGCSDADMLSISLKNLSVGEAKGASAPAAPSDLTATTRTNGELKADIALTAPTLDLNGDALESLESVRLMRNDSLIHTFDSPAPGAELTYVDEVPECSRYTYSAIAVNGSGESPAIETSAFVGVLEPSNPTGISLTEGSKPGEVILKWTPVTTDIRNNTLDPAFVTYRIYGGDGLATLLFDGITGDSYTFQATDDVSTQSFVQYALVAETRGGISDFMNSPLLPLGPAYATPFVESFANGTPATIIGLYSDNLATWKGFTNETGIESQDGDNGFFGSEGSYLQDSATFITGKIDLSGLETPTLTFYTYNIVDGEDRDINTLRVSAIANGTVQEVKSFQICDLGDQEGWLKVEASLEAYKSQTIQLEFTSLHALYPYIFIDNLRIDNYGASAIETATSASVFIAGGQGEIIIAGATHERVEVFTIDGHLVTQQTIAAPEYRLPLTPGIYIARVGQTTQKVIVK